MDNYEKQQIERLARDDEKALEEIFIDHYTNLVNFAFEFVRYRDVAEDIVSEAFFGLWKNRKNIRINVSVRAYLFRVIHNACINYLNHLKVREKYSQQTNFLLKEEMYLMGERVDHPLNILLTSELKNKIDAAVDSLPPQCRQIFIKNRFEGKKNSEIASELNISEATVKKQMGIALKKLRDLLFILITVLEKFF